MIFNLILVGLGSVIQLVLGFLRWRWNRKDLSRKQQIWADVGFIVFWLIGTLLIVISTYRSNRHERAHFAFEVRNSYQAKSDAGAVVPYSWFRVNKPIAFNLYQVNVGSGAAYNVNTKARAILEPDFSLSSQRAAVGEFSTWLKSEVFQARGTEVKGRPDFITAYGNVLSPEDFENLREGRKIVFVVGRTFFEDDFGSHIAESCFFLEPQAQQPPNFPYSPVVLEIFAECAEHNSETP